MPLIYHMLVALTKPFTGIGLYLDPSDFWNRCTFDLPTKSTCQQLPTKTMTNDRNAQRISFLHQVFNGFAVDVTREFPELLEVIQYAESKGWIEVDVKSVAYKLTEIGRKVHDRYIAEAQDLIRRFDIYADVDVDSLGQARFDTGLGKDLRVPVMEIEGVDPFRARFLLGLNDGEWDELSNWMELFQDKKWYADIFAPIDEAPSTEEIGQQRLASIIDQAKSELRRQSQQ